MLQIYHFHGDDMDAVYAEVNEFLSNVSTIPSVEIEPENIKPDTKNYLNYNESITTINVIVNFKLATAQDIELVEKMHRTITARPEHEPVAVVEDNSFDTFIDSDDLP